MKKTNHVVYAHQNLEIVVSDGVTTIISTAADKQATLTIGNPADVKNLYDLLGFVVSDAKELYGKSVLK